MKDLLIDGLNFRCTNNVEKWRVETLLTKEKGTIQWLRAELQAGECLWDIGANIGCYTLYAARLAGPDGRVVAFEPHLESAASLLWNWQLNKSVAPVDIVTMPLAKRSGFASFNYSEITAGASNNQLSNEPTSSVMAELKYAVAGDEVLSHVRQPNLIKLDVDGLELQILKGMQNVLLGVRSLQVEVTPANMDSIGTLLLDAGFKLAERHWTANGKKAIAKGADPLSVVHNAIYQRSA